MHSAPYAKGQVTNEHHRCVASWVDMARVFQSSRMLCSLPLFWWPVVMWSWCMVVWGIPIALFIKDRHFWCRITHPSLNHSFIASGKGYLICILCGILQSLIAYGRALVVQGSMALLFRFVSGLYVHTVLVPSSSRDQCRLTRGHLYWPVHSWITQICHWHVNQGALYKKVHQEFGPVAVLGVDGRSLWLVLRPLVGDYHLEASQWFEYWFVYKSGGFLVDKDSFEIGRQIP